MKMGLLRGGGKKENVSDPSQSITSGKMWPHFQELFFSRDGIVVFVYLCISLSLSRSFSKRS
jgi:hypothetical protein